MSAEDEAWGEPPVGDVIARLLAERYPIGGDEKLTVDVVEAEPKKLALALWSARHRYEIDVAYQAGADGRDPWMLMVDALDALFGSLLESGRAHRDLPSGPGVQYEGAFFEVYARHDLPEVSKLADQLLIARGAPQEPN